MKLRLYSTQVVVEVEVWVELAKNKVAFRAKKGSCSTKLYWTGAGLLGPYGQLKEEKQTKCSV